MKEMTLHGHIWILSDVGEELTLEWLDTQPNMCEPPDNDGYIQFSTDLYDGRVLEVRIPLDFDPKQFLFDK